MNDRHLRSHQAIHRGPRDRLRRDAEFAVQHFGRSGRAKAGHADEFAAVAEPARPVALNRGLDAYSWNSSKHAGPVFTRLLAKQIEARCRNDRGADAVAREQLGRIRARSTLRSPWQSK